MPKAIRRAAVLGAGVMGSQIAAHLANVGIPTLLLDVVPKELTPDEARKGLTLEAKPVRNRLALGALQRLGKLKPSPLYSPEVVELITPGNLEDDLARVAEVDLIIEAVVEDLAVKQALWKRVAEHWQPGTIAASNTSGISIAAIAEATPAAFRQHFLGAHFFNPPRYMKLLELIPTPETDPAVVQQMRAFGEEVLGKGVVLCKDTPNFIGNRIGVYGLMVVLDAMQRYGLTVDEVDALTGPVIGRPKSATFRTLDVVGIDTFVLVADNCRATIQGPEAEVFTVPESLRELVRRGWLGQKSKQGFFRKERGEIQVVDLDTLQYRPRQRASFASLEAAKAAPDLAQRIRTLAFAQDKAGQFLWDVLKRTLLYSAEKVGEIADDFVSIDSAMKWGYNWDLGPFELWDAMGVAESVARMKAEGEAVPAWVEEAAARGGFYAGRDAAAPVSGRVIAIDGLKAQGRVVREKKGATLLDMGDGVLLLETHSPKAAIGPDVIAMMRQAAEELHTGKWAGLVIGAQTPNFCVGANLMMILMEAQEEEWDEIDLIIKQFQDAAMQLKYAPRPVVAAPYGMTLGGGYEIAAAADVIVAAGETYMGLVEVGAGLIPGGGGNKEMLIRALEGLPVAGGGLGASVALASGAPVDLQPLVNKVFETIATAKVSTSGPEARGLGYLRKTDRIVANRDHLLYEAKKAVLALDQAGYQPPKPVTIPVLGPEGRAVLEMAIYGMQQGHYATEYDGVIARKLAYVLTGGDVPGRTYVSEQYLLDLEREAFLSLCGEKRSQERMQYILKTGKPLRN